MNRVYIFLSSNQIVIFFIIIIVLSILLIIYIMKYRIMYNNFTQIKNIEKKSSDLLRQILDTIPDPVFCKDADGIYIECNREFANVIGLRREDIIGRTVFEINQEDDQAKIYHKADVDLMKSKGTQIYETKFKYTDGSIQDVVFRKATLLSNNGGTLGLVGVMINITELKKNEKRIDKMLKVKEAFIEINQSMIDFSNINDFFNMILEKAISIIDGADHGSILKLKENSNLEIVAYKNYNLEKVRNFSLPLKQSFIWVATKGNLKNTVIIDDVCKLNCETIDAVGRNNNWKIRSTITTPIIINEKLYGLLNIDSDKESAFLLEDLEIMEYIKVQVGIAISKHMLYEEKIYLSRYDKLTDLYNRRYFEELYSNLFRNIDKNEMPFNIVVFDINDLKFVNDNYGHITGDEYIKAFAHELKGMANSSDIVARYGGDEFIGVFFNTNTEELRHRIEDILKGLSVNPINRELSIFCSFSFGIAKFPEDDKDYNQLINIADKRMYDYKREYKTKRIK